MDASTTDKPEPDGSSDIYGIRIPVDLCEDALLEFASNVNGFMEAKFEVCKQCISLNYSYMYPFHRGNKAARSGTRTQPQLTLKF
jgi:hypothetical protein